MGENSIYLIVLAIYTIVIGPDFIRLLKVLKAPKLSTQERGLFRRLHLLVLITSVFLTFVVVMFEVNLIAYSSPIEYSRIAEISLQDFNGLKRPGQKLQGQESFAFISTSIEWELTGKEVSIKSYFHPARSYIYKDNITNEQLLKHELYHFHLTEVYARILRKEVKELRQAPSRHALNLLLKKAYESENGEQAKYDYETDHGYLLGKQLFWQQKIDSLLTELEFHANPHVTFQ